MAVMAGKRKRTPVGAAFGRVGKATVAALAAAAMLIPAAAAQADPLDGWKPARPNSELGLPTFKGINLDRTFDTGVGYDPSTGYLAKVFEKDKAAFEQNIADGKDETGYDYWIDRMLARTGTAPTRDPNGQSFEGPYGTETSVTTGQDGKGNTYSYNGYDSNGYLFTRGRAAFMYTYDPSVIGFGGNLAYWDVTGQEGYDVVFSADGSTLSLSEDGDSRKQTPSYWKSDYATQDGSLHVGVVKYITDNNVLVTELRLTSDRDRTVTMDATAPLATSPEGDELTGRFAAYNNVTTVYPRFSGNGFTPKDGRLTASMDLKAGQTQVTKLQLGLTTTEIPQSRTDYDAIRAGDLRDPVASYSSHVTAYNKWWADNIPYIETGDESHNIDKTVFYRWWLNRFNYLDANMPGNVLQYPTSIEGVLGYNNAIDLTIGMFMEDYKWMRNPEWSYGPWLSAGETQGSSGQYRDNPAAPDNWGASHMQWISEAAWDSYKIHGGPADVAGKLADYASSDTKGQLAIYDSDGDDLLDTNWNAWTGNDADAVSFDEVSGARLDRAESATVWSGAVAAAEAYRLAGEEDKAKEMDEYASRIKTSYLKNLWDGSDKIVRHQFADGAKKGQQARYKEINNLMGYGTGMMPAKGDKDYDDDYEAGLRLLADADEHPIFPFATANQADDRLVRQLGKKPTNNFSVINSEQYFRAYGRALRQYHGEENGYVTPEMFKQLLYWNAFAHYQGGDNRYPDQNEFWNNASTDDGGRIQYRSWIHHTQLGTTNWTMIEDVAGMVPRTDGKLELDPIAIPGWNHFTVNNLSYHGQDVTIVWNGDGHYANAPKGYSAYVGGTLALTADRLAHLVYDPATGEVTVKDDSGAKVVTAAKTGMPDATGVTYTAADRVTDLLAKAGVNADRDSASQTNLAEGKSVQATVNQDTAAKAVDGTVGDQGFWNQKGSANATDSLTVDFGKAETVDDIRLYFYQTSTTATVSGYAEPSVYRLEYDNGDGTWRAIDGQNRTPQVPQANYNRVQFPAVSACRIRVTVTPQDGLSIGLKEIQAYHTGAQVQAGANAAPYVDAYVKDERIGRVVVSGTVKDDGLPADGSLTTTWSVKSVPEEGATASIEDPTAITTAVTFSGAGRYVLTLTASDGQSTASSDVAIDAEASDGTVNVAADAKPEADYTATTWYNIDRVNDGAICYSQSEGYSTNAWGTWNEHNESSHWLQYNWDIPMRLTKASIAFWYDGGGTMVPASWKLQYWDDSSQSWKDVTLREGTSYPAEGDQMNTVEFADTVVTTKLRATFTAASSGSTNYGIAVSEFEAYAEDPLGLDEPYVSTKTHAKPDMPKTVSAYYGDGSRVDLPVTWDGIDDERLASDADFTVAGKAKGTSLTPVAHVYVRSQEGNTLNATVAAEQTVYRGAESFEPPATVAGVYNNGANHNVPVTWNEDDLKAVNLAAEGSYTVHGVARSDVGHETADATLTVSVVDSGKGGDTPTPSIPDRDALKAAVGRAQSTDHALYDATSLAALDKALADGQRTLADKNASDDAIAAAAKALDAALQGLKALDPAPRNLAPDGTPKASFTTTWNSLNAINDGRVSFTPSGDTDADNQSTWGTWSADNPATQWVGVTWKEPVTVGSASVFFWYDNQRTGTADNVPMPVGWKVQYLPEGVDPDKASEDDWKDVAAKGDYPLARDAANTVSFDPVTAAALRVVVTADGNGSKHAAVAASELQAFAAQETVDRSALAAALDKAAALQSGDYRQDGWDRLQQAVQAGRTAMDDSSATQEQVAKAAQDILDAIAALERKPDTSKLQNAVTVIRADIQSGTLRESDYTKDSWEALTDALAAADRVLADQNATQKQVDEALTALKAARSGLTDATEQPGDKPGSGDEPGDKPGSGDEPGDKPGSGDEPGDKPGSGDKADLTALRQAVDRAARLRASDYTAASWAAFSTALGRAQTVLSEGDGASQADVDAALTALESAQAGLVPVGQGGQGGQGQGGQGQGGQSGQTGHGQESGQAGTADGESTARTGSAVAVVAVVAALLALAGAAALRRRRS